MSYTPLVSIIIPVYNGSNYLAKAIDSALAQTYADCEILVINDGSKDNGATREIALSYGNKINYFEKENGGVATALNLGIEKMRGEYFSWLSHDDEYHPNKVQRQIDFINEYALKETILFTDFEVIDANSRVLDVVTSYNRKLNDFDAIVFGLINGCTTLIPRKCFETAGCFNPELPNTQDYDMWFRLNTSYTIKHLPEVLVRSRHHGQQQSRTDNSYSTDCNNFHISLIKYVAANNKVSAPDEEERFLKLAAYLRKVQYNQALDYLLAHYIKQSWVNEFKILYYLYIDTSWGSSVGVHTALVDPRRFLNKVFSKAIARLR